MDTQTFQDGCTVEKNPKSLGLCAAALPPCGNRCRLSESAICSSQVRPPLKIKLNLKFKALRWRLLRWRLTLSEFWPQSSQIPIRILPWIFGGFSSHFFRTKKAQKFFQHKLFGPHPKPPNLERTQKGDPHKLFRRDFRGQKRGPKRAISATYRANKKYYTAPLFVFRN